MKGIEERAILNLQYEKDFLGRNLSDDMVCRAYIKGATEQKAIDIEKACKACENELRRLKTLLNERGSSSSLISVGKSLSNIRKEMEE